MCLVSFCVQQMHCLSGSNLFLSARAAETPPAGSRASVPRTGVRERTIPSAAMRVQSSGGGMRDCKVYRDQAGWRMSPRYDDNILMVGCFLWGGGLYKIFRYAQ